METKIPQTKNEAFAQLDAMLSEEDKSAIMNGDPFESGKIIEYYQRYLKRKG